MASVMMSESSLAQSVQGPGGPGGQPVAKGLMRLHVGKDGRGDKNSGKEVGFVAVVSRADGALSACESPVAVPLRECAEGVLKEWHLFTGEMEATPQMNAVFAAIWKDGFESGYGTQRNGQVSCKVVEEKVRGFGAWGYCRTRFKAAYGEDYPK